MGVIRGDTRGLDYSSYKDLDEGAYSSGLGEPSASRLGPRSAAAAV